MNQKNIKEYIRALDHISNFLRTLLDEENLAIAEPKDKLSEFTGLRVMSRSNEWPEAVPKELICGDNEEEKLSRAEGIVQDFIQEDLTDKKFLDFGCGEGHIPFVAAYQNPKVAIGYDIQESKVWEKLKKDKVTFTKDWETVKRSGPFDVILINDVLDHTKDPKIILKEVCEIKEKEGKIILRVHPWTSRHGTHMYKSANKAYLHLVFSEEELYSMGLKPMETLKILDPLKFYRKIIKELNLEILQEQITTQPVELFFTQKTELLRRIKMMWKNSENPELASGAVFPRDIIEIQFIDFILA